MHNLYADRPKGRRRKTIALIILSLLLVLTFLVETKSKAGVLDKAHTNPVRLPCSQTYQSGQQLFSPETAQKILAAPEQLAPFIKSISNRRYWGLSSNLQLKKRPEAPSPYVLELAIPKGAINPGNKLAPRGGAGYHWTPELPADTRTACLSYSVWFPQDFDFVKGGKLPGLFGGTGPSGGKKVTGTNGFSTRYMWRRKGDGEVYAYIIGNDRRGISLERGAWRFPRGKWTRLEQEVILNTPGKPDGMVRVCVNGKLMMEKTGLVYRTTRDVTISGIMAHVFFGGKKPSWASTKDTIVRMTPFDLRWSKRASVPTLGQDAEQLDVRQYGSGH